jgi:hypothetical protein
MAPLKVGDTFPEAKFAYIPYTEEKSDVVACGTPGPYDAHKVQISINSILIVGIQGKESSFVCCARSFHSGMSGQAFAALCGEV